MIDFDSHLSDFKLPKKLYKMDDDPKPRCEEESDSEEEDVSVEDNKSDNISVSGRGDLFESDRFFLSMGALNASYSMA